MEFFVDTNVIVYAATEGPYRAASIRTLEAISRGDTTARTSTAVIEEVWHIELSGRVGNVAGLAERAYQLFSPLLSVSDSTMQLALALLADSLGANDRLHLAACLENDIEWILTADTDFDRAPGVKRVDPLDE